MSLPTRPNKLESFEKGLKAEIKKLMASHERLTMEDAYNVALRIKRDFTEI